MLSENVYFSGGMPPSYTVSGGNGSSCDSGRQCIKCISNRFSVSSGSLEMGESFRRRRPFDVCAKKQSVKNREITARTNWLSSPFVIQRVRDGLPDLGRRGYRIETNEFLQDVAIARDDEVLGNAAALIHLH